MAGRRLLGANGKFITPNNKKASVAAVVASNNENLFKLIASEKSHISQVNSATPDFNTIIHDNAYGTFSNNTYQATLAAEKTNKVGFSGKNSSDIAAANAIKDAEKAKIKALDDAHYSLSGKAAREQQGLSWYQPLDISTVGGNTRHNRGGLDAQGDYLDQDFMSFDTPENFTGKKITTNLRSAKDIELFGDSLNQINEINMVSGSESLKNFKDKERIVTSLIDGQDPADADNYAIQKIKENANFQTQLELVQDERSKLQIVSDAIDTVTKPAADFISEKFVELNDSTVLGTLTGHLVDSKNAASQSLDRFVDNVSDIGKGVVDFGMGYVDAGKSIASIVSPDTDFIRPSEFADMREQRVQIEIAAEKAAIEAQQNIETGYKDYYSSRVIGAELDAAAARKDAEAKATEILSHQKAHTHRQQVVDEWKVEQEIEAFEKQLEIDLANDRSAKIGESQRQRLVDVRERIAKVEREKHDKVQNDRIDDIANKSDEAAALAAEEKAKKQREAHDQFQNDRIDRIAEESTAEFDALRKKMHENAQHTLGNDSAFANPPVEKSKIPEKYATFGDKLGNTDLLVGKDPFRFTTLTYPTEVTTSPEYGHYMLFYVNVQNKTKYKYHGYNDDGNYAVIGDIIETQSKQYESAPPGELPSQESMTKYKTNYHYNTGANADEVAYQKQQSYSGARGNVLQSNQVTLMRQRQPTEGVAARVDLTSRITDSVALYLPPDVTNNVNASYTGFDMGLLGYLALGGADIVNQVKNRDFEGAAENFIGTGERMLTEMIKKAGITAVDAAFGGGGGTEQVFNKIFGQTTNPFIEVAFNNMSLREFSYTFNFRPRSADETDEVKAIIQLFRFHMAPELKGTNHRYMTLPSTFDIHYMYQTDPETATENTFYNKIATCVLERCDVNYTPTGVKSFDDGAPTEISMSLGFKETELLTKQKINDGF